ncbi:glycosyltransferase [Smaragdicoccus niigatensis]|uniref:glycosyltransferase n=1 Tax=Smaragdicoccus niigatensis TaxID=359359 RepID=UPI00035EE5D8|nr:glycosyltransferase [Smaragdicoccus niigatensis]
MSKIVILAFGTRGDVAPVTGLGTALAAAGFSVAVAAQEPYRDLVTHAGLEFRHLPRDTEEETRNSASAQDLINGGRMKPSRNALADMVDQLRGVGPAMAEVAKDADLLIAASPVSSLFGYHIAQGLKIPSVGAFLQPLARTGDFPPPPLGTRSLGRLGNHALWKMGALGDKVYLPLINDLRAELGLPATTLQFQKERDAQWAILNGFSEFVVPRPQGWRENVHITGYWWPPVDPDWQPSAELTAFLDDGPAPVFVGLGSTATNNGDQLSETISAAVRKSSVRTVVQSGWARLHADGDDVLTIDDAPHEWLFSRCAAVVHHCGAGTTAAALRAGVPSVPTPGIMDQPFWAKRLHELGAGTAPVPRRELTVDSLADAIAEAVSNVTYRASAGSVGERLAAEDGVGNAVRLISNLAY